MLVSYGQGAVAANAMRVASDFEQTLAEVRFATNASDEELEVVRDRAKELATTTTMNHQQALARAKREAIERALFGG